ncbi:hypothetical protein GDO78_012203 [Eleutherodactylus coqui]|uniref:Uncharacterized protein n=1 Tax=Eleutherodactylus coqui TaxID=57060 RepID=A0A8J6F4J0_ELECQ|nr:hypothetical protein GDO78_012203 [Eleutherodactylus coqui]
MQHPSVFIAVTNFKQRVIKRGCMRLKNSTTLDHGPFLVFQLSLISIKPIEGLERNINICYYMSIYYMLNASRRWTNNFHLIDSGELALVVTHTCVGLNPAHEVTHEPLSRC